MKRVPQENLHTRAELISACVVIWERFRIKQGNRAASHVQQENLVGKWAHQNARGAFLENILLNILHANARHALQEHIKTTVESRAVPCVAPERFSSGNQSSECQACQPGTFAAQNGSQSCDACAVGSNSTWGLKPVSNVKGVRLNFFNTFCRVGWKRWHL